MKATVLLRASSVVALLQGVAHTLAILTYVPHHGAEESAVVAAMQAHAFHFGGPLAHSYWDLYFGYALLAALQCFVEAVLFWILSGWTGRVSLRPVLWLFAAANLVHAALVLRFFFLTPLVPDLLVTACLLGASLVSGPPSEAAAP